MRLRLDVGAGYDREPWHASWQGYRYLYLRSCSGNRHQSWQLHGHMVFTGYDLEFDGCHSARLMLTPGDSVVTSSGINSAHACVHGHGTPPSHRAVRYPDLPSCTHSTHAAAGCVSYSTSSVCAYTLSNSTVSHIIYTAVGTEEHFNNYRSAWSHTERGGPCIYAPFPNLSSCIMARHCRRHAHLTSLQKQ